jgi:hypothetical protein
MLEAIGRLFRRVTARRLNAEIAANLAPEQEAAAEIRIAGELPPLAQDLYDRWRQVRRGGADLPLWPDLSASDLSRWQDNLVIIDVRPGGRYFYQSYGRVFQELFQKDMTGKYTTEIPEQQRIMIELEYNHCITQRSMVSRVYTADFGGATMTWHRMVLPVSLAGRDVDKLLVVAYQTGARRP